uniref:Very long-chain fatty acid transport protein n=1 Tax=Ditylenchus dipsaci TaxID=166011 RepID=A0A915DDR9_9BILA
MVTTTSTNSNSCNGGVAEKHKIVEPKKKRHKFWLSPLLEFGGLSLFLALIMGSPYWLSISVAYLLVRMLSSDFVRRCVKTMPRDLRGISCIARLLWIVKRALKKNKPIHEHFLDQVGKHPDKECVVQVDTGKSLTFRQLNQYSNKYANFFKSRDYQKDQVVALFLENGIEFFAIWMGLSKLGVITAWINTNLKMDSLAHSIQVSGCQAIITSPNLLPTLVKALQQSENKMERKIYLVDGTGDAEVLSRLIEDKSVEEPLKTEGLDIQSILCYIYTSGTTGNPKAAIIKHYRYYMMASAAKCAFIKEGDRIYITMPMFHSAGGIIGMGQVITAGITAVIRSKFSASNFWKDCVRYDCTCSQYIGEICRYLLAQKFTPEERQHRVRILYGNGMRPEIWREFVTRFGVQRIGELYGSTEGNSNILNVDNHEGIYPVKLIRIDEETGDILRTPDGLCVLCRPGEMGEMVGIIKPDDPLVKFEGYVNKEESQKKVIHDVMRKGDGAFSSGDILYWDKLGYLYFRDRRGDTGGVVMPIKSIVDACAYGVLVPGNEGRAGMLAVALADGTYLDTFIKEVSSRLHDNLASFAVPVFLRICKEVDQTGTYKLKKTLLQKEGYDVHQDKPDPVYYWDAASKVYKRLDAKMQSDIDQGIYNRI